MLVTGIRLMLTAVDSKLASGINKAYFSTVTAVKMNPTVVHQKERFRKVQKCTRCKKVL